MSVCGLFALGLGFLALLSSAPCSRAASVVNQRPLIKTLDGGDSSIGSFTAVGSLAIDEANGDVFMLNTDGSGKGFNEKRVVCKFDAEGKAQDFSALGRSCLDGVEPPGKLSTFGMEGVFEAGAFRTDVAVDNSGGEGKAGEGEQGRIYVSEEGGPIHAFAPDGTYLWTLPRTVADPCGIAVDREGHLWVGNGDNFASPNKRALEFSSSGSPPPQISEVAMTNGSERPCRLAIDDKGTHTYIGLAPSGVDKYTEGLYDSTLTANTVFDVTIDQSKQTGHLFTTESTQFREYEPCESPKCPGKEIAGSPFGGDLIGNARGIAYNPALDWVYVSDRASNTVKVFGPKASGTAPDVSCQSVDAIGLHEATAHCTINPLGLANSYHFESKEGEGASWGAAKTSPPQSIEPTDSSPHQVSFTIKGLKSNKAHQLRLAGTSAENGLTAYSSAIPFKTLSPPPPEIKECSVTAITASSAQVGCTINPFGEETSWWVETSTDPKCETGFAKLPSHVIPEGEAGTVKVQENLSGLLAAQHYCVRVNAEGPGNEPGHPTQTTKKSFLAEKDEFKTLAIPPSDAGAAFAAPRTDTSARINARIDPNGEADFSYRFEWSEDGSSWNQLPIHSSSLHAREPVVVADELSELEPATTYHYRLGLAENEAGSAASLGEEKAFTTRTSAEMTLPPSALGKPGRGIELVNNPEKGTQNLNALGPGAGGSPMSENGEEVFWSVSAGAPGAPNGTLNTFLAGRSGEGWKSQSIAPPASEQQGGGELAHAFIATTPDFRTYVLNVTRSAVLAQADPPSFVRVRQGQSEEALAAYTVQAPNGIYQTLLELSDDGAHAIFPNNTTLQLEDIGTPGAPEVLSILPEGKESECGLDPEGSSFGDGKTFGGGFQHRAGYRWIATTDASRIYFEANANGECSGPLRLYERDREKGTTIEIDPGAGNQPPQFIRATPDGRGAYFLTSNKLDPADENKGPDIYRWDEEAGESSCLTCTVAKDAEVSGSVMISGDFSHIYFESSQQLIEGLGKSGAVNLYVLRGGTLGFVGVVGGDVLSQGKRPALSTDGNALLLEAPASRALTADAVNAECPEPSSNKPGPCEELYRYEDAEGSLECLSCSQGTTTTHSTGTPAGTSGVHFQQSGDGRTDAFATQQALLPLDVNQDTDIYEWRGGTLRLITDGVSNFQTDFTAPQVLAIDEDGSDLLFALVPPGGSLTGYEHDKLLNLYDARIGGGFPPPAPEVHCESDSCQGPLQAAPPAQDPNSLGFAGRGNEAPGHKACAKGKVRRRGHCVAKKKHTRKGQKHRRKGPGGGGKGGSR
jgi:DNA-binding beta-propeller fold protein YncE